MKASAVFLSATLFLLLLQTTIAPEFVLLASRLPGLGFLEGHTLDFALIALLHMVFHRNLFAALLWGAFVGILAGSFGMAWRGATTLGYFSVVLFGSFFRRQVLVESRGALFLMVAGLSILEGLFHLAAGHLFSRIPDPFGSQWGTLLTQAGLNGLAALPLDPVFRKLDLWAGGVPPSARRGLLVDG